MSEPSAVGVAVGGGALAVPPSAADVPPLDEAQVKAAVQFLSNPTVAASPITRRMTFLYKSKGLKSAEIAEALRRVAPASAEYRALVEGLAAGKDPVEAVAGMDPPPATTATTPTTTSSGAAGSTTSIVPATHAHPPSSSSYPYPAAAPPGFIAGPPAYAGGPPVFYPLPRPPLQPAPPASSSWGSVAMTTMGVLGAVAAAGYVAKRAFGLEITRSPQADSASAAAAAAAAASEAAASGTAAPASSTSTLSPAVASSAPLTSAPDRLAQSQQQQSQHNSAILESDTSSDDDGSSSSDDDDDEPKEKFLGAWLGNTPAAPSPSSSGAGSKTVKSGKKKKSRRRRRNRVAIAALTSQLTGVSDKLDTLVDTLREQQAEWRRMTSSNMSSFGSSSAGSSSSLGGSGKTEALLSSSIQTQNEMLATLKIMMAAQARSHASAHAGAVLAGAATVPPTSTPSLEQQAPSVFGSAAPPSLSAASSSGSAPAHPPGRSWIDQNLGSHFGGVTTAAGSTGGLLGTSGPAIVDPSSLPAGPSSATSTPPSGSMFDPSHPAVAPTSAGVANGGLDPVVESLRSLDDALASLRADNTAEEVRGALASMALYMDNILSNLSTGRYRKILLTNSSYEARVRKVRGGERVLLAAGFEIRHLWLEWVLPDSSPDAPPPAPAGSASEGTGSGLVFDEQQKLRLLRESLALVRATQARVEAEISSGAVAPAATMGLGAPPSSFGVAPSAAPAPMPMPPQQQPPSQQLQQPSGYAPQLNFNNNSTNASALAAYQQHAALAAPQPMQQQVAPHMTNASIAQPQHPPVMSAYQQAWQQQQQQMQQQAPSSQSQQQPQAQPQPQPAPLYSHSQLPAPPAVPQVQHPPPEAFQTPQPSRAYEDASAGWQPDGSASVPPTVSHAPPSQSLLQQQQHAAAFHPAAHSQPATPWPQQQQQPSQNGYSAYNPAPPLGPPQFAPAQPPPQQPPQVYPSLQQPQQQQQSQQHYGQQPQAYQPAQPSQPSQPQPELPQPPLQQQPDSVFGLSNGHTVHGTTANGTAPSAGSYFGNGVDNGPVVVQQPPPLSQQQEIGKAAPHQPNGIAGPQDASQVHQTA